MRKIVTTVFFIVLYNISFSQVWNSLTSLTSGNYSRCAAFSLGDTGYVIEGSYNDGVWAYDTASHNWFQVTNYPTNYTDGLVGCSLNGIGYAGTGASCCFDFTSNFYKYDPNVGLGGTWTQLASFPGAARAYGVAFVLDGKIYVGGGLTNFIGGSTGAINYQNGYSVTPYNDFWVYNPGTNTWDSIAHCPALGVSCDAVAFVIGDTAYVGTGGSVTLVDNGESVPQRDFWKYDTTSKVWTQIDSLPGKTRAEATAFATCDKGYVGLGYIDVSRDTDATDFWQYNPYLGNWLQIANFGGGARNGAPAFTIGKTGYVAGGALSGTYLNDFWSYAALVTPGFSADTAVCQGSTITFTDTSNYSPTNWYWSFTGGTPDTSTMQNPTITYTGTGNFDVTLTAWNGCDSATKTFSKYITVTAWPTLSITPATPTVCNNQSVTLMVQGAKSYKWVGTSDTTDSLIVNPVRDTSYELMASNGICTKDTFIAVKAGKLSPSVFPQAQTICSGQSLALKASGGDTYSWSPATGLNETTGDSVVADPTASVTYTITVMDSAGCSGVAFDSITVFPAPNVPVITQRGDTLFSSAKTDNQWYENGKSISGADSSYLVIGNSTDTFTVAVNNPADGCTSVSAPLITSGINQLSVISSQLSIFPNPTNGTITMNISSSANDIGDWKLRLTDVLGQIIYTRNSLSYSNEIDLSSLAGGVYFITITAKKGEGVVKVIKQ